MTYEDQMQILLSRELARLDFSCYCPDPELCGCAPLDEPCRCDGEMDCHDWQLQELSLGGGYLCPDCYQWTADPEDAQSRYATCMKPSSHERRERSREAELLTAFGY